MINACGQPVALQHGNVIAFDIKSKQLYAFKDKTCSEIIGWFCSAQEGNGSIMVNFFNEKSFSIFALILACAVNTYPKKIYHDHLLAYELMSKEEINMSAYLNFNISELRENQN